MENGMAKSALPALLVALGIALSGFFVAHAITNFKLFDRYVTVKGLAERQVRANEAIWQVQFSFSSDTTNDLYQGIESSQEKLKAFLAKYGFKAENMEIQPISVTDNQGMAYTQNAKVKRYRATSGITVNTADVDKVRAVLQQTGELVQAGVVVTQSNVRYLYTDLNQIKPQMLDEATANAEVAAESFAKNSHSRINGIRNASQGLFSINDVGSTYSSDTDINKKVRVVTTVQYFLR